jgi:hypothetical protein
MAQLPFAFMQYTFNNFSLFIIYMSLIFSASFLYMMFIKTSFYCKFQRVINIYFLIIMCLFILSSIIYIFFPTFILINEDVGVGVGINLANNIDLYNTKNNFYPYHSNIYGTLYALVSYISQKLPFDIMIKSKILFIGVFLLFIALTVKKLKGLDSDSTKNNILKFISINYFLILIAYSMVSYAAKPEPFLLFLVSLTIYLANKIKNINLSIIFIGILSGIAISFKIHGAIYILIAFFASSEINVIKVKKILLFFVLSFIVALLPFLHPNISLYSCIETYIVLSNHGLNLILFIKSIFIVIFLLSPIIILLLYLSLINKKLNKTLKFNILLLVCFEILLCIVNSKPGIAATHFIPIIPANAFLLYKLIKYIDIIDLKLKLFKIFVTVNQSLYLTISFMCLINTFLLYYSFIEYWPKAAKASTEIQYLNNKYSNSVMGVTNLESHYLYINRIYLNSTQIDFSSFFDLHYAGISDTGLIKYMNNCSIKYFIMPKSGISFELKNPYTGDDLISKQAKQIFYKNFTIIDSTDYYNIFKCHGDLKK